MLWGRPVKARCSRLARAPMLRHTVVSTRSPVIIVVEVIVRSRPLLLPPIIGLLRRLIFVARLLIRSMWCWAVMLGVHVLWRCAYCLCGARPGWHAHTTPRTGNRTWTITRRIVRYAVPSWRRSHIAHLHLWLSCGHRHTPSWRPKILLGEAIRATITGTRLRWTASLVRVVLWRILSRTATGAIHWRRPASVSVTGMWRHWPSGLSHAVATQRWPLATRDIHSFHLMRKILLHIVLRSRAREARIRAAAAAWAQRIHCWSSA
jgi:heme exporter protein D